MGVTLIPCLNAWVGIDRPQSLAHAAGAALQVFEGNNEPGRPAKGDQYGFGIRYRRPSTKGWIARVDAMYGVREFADEISGMRFEIRRKV